MRREIRIYSTDEDHDGTKDRVIIDFVKDGEVIGRSSGYDYDQNKSIDHVVVPVDLNSDDNLDMLDGFVMKDLAEMFLKVKW